MLSRLGANLTGMASPEPQPAPSTAAIPDQARAEAQPVSFGPNCAWLAVKGIPPRAVLYELPVRDPHPSGWADGLHAAQDGMVFVTPTLDQWVLVVCNALPDAGDKQQPDSITPMLKRVSSKLETTVQYFGTQRQVEYQAWAWAEKGRIIRAFAYLGKQAINIIDVGDFTAAELELHLDFTQGSAESSSSMWEKLEHGAPDEKLVMMLAGKWSVDPSTLAHHPEYNGTGWVGYPGW